MKKILFVLFGIAIAIVPALLGNSDLERGHTFIALCVRMVAAITLIIFGLSLIVEHSLVLVRIAGGPTILIGLLILLGYVIRVEQC